MTSDVKLRGEGEEGKGDRYGEGKFVRGRVVCVCFCFVVDIFLCKNDNLLFLPKEGVN